MEERVTAAKLLQGHIAHLLPGVLEDIEPLKDVEDRQKLEEQLKPWLAQEVAEEIGQMIDSRDLLEGILQDFKFIHRIHFLSSRNRKTSSQTPRRVIHKFTPCTKRQR